MRIQLNLWPALAFVGVLLAWLAFALTFLLHKKSPAPPDKKRDPASFTGVALQGLSYALLWIFKREWFTPIFGSGKLLEIILAVVIVLLASASVWLCAAAVRTLGVQWSLAARIVEGHKLVTQGPYSIVRNPIYTGMLGMLLATGLAVSRWIGLVFAILVFAIGTFIRVSREERLLREMFGREFDDYAQRVRAVIPFLI